MKRNKNSKIALLILLFSLMACTRESYKNFDGLNRYTNDVFNLRLEDMKNSIIYYLPVDGCNTCQSSTLNLQMLDNVSDDKQFYLIIIGTAEGNDKIGEDLRRIREKFTNLYSDPLRKNMKYPTGIIKPLLLHIDSEGELIYYMSVDDGKVDEAAKYLKDNL